MLDLTGRGKLCLELAHLRPHREHPALEDIGDFRELALADVGPT
jgi:hypothetical protein